MLKKSLGLSAYITILAVMAVTAKADATFSGKLSGAQTAPPNASRAVGAGTVILNNAETRITISLDFSGLGSNQTAAHIHGPAGPGSEAPVLFNLGSQGATSGTFINLSAAVSRGQVAQLRAGKWYFDVHSTKLLHGEIRGQILPGGESPATSVDNCLRLYRFQSPEFRDELECLDEGYRLTLESLLRTGAVCDLPGTQTTCCQLSARYRTASRGDRIEALNCVVQFLPPAKL